MGRRKEKEMKSTQLAEAWKELLVGQDHFIDKVTPYVVRAMAGLNAPGKPIAIFLLMGPTGTGKTRAAETLATVLHGDEKNLLRIDCAEFQMEHEVAKLLGAPPGYLGHRETQPIINQQKLAAVTSDKCTFSIVLFDEIEKAHASIHRVLLGIMDKATLRLGDNSSVNFDKTIIFMSSNLGAKEIAELFNHNFGFSVSNHDVKYKDISKAGLGAMGKKFPPEFQNRVDEVITFKPLDEESLLKITAMELNKIRFHMYTALGAKCFCLSYDDPTIALLAKIGTSETYGARELKRSINRNVLNPISDDILDGKIPAGSKVNCFVADDHIEWSVEEIVSETAPAEEVAVAVASNEPEGRRVKKAKRSDT